jgi:hypothetical protein
VTESGRRSSKPPAARRRPKISPLERYHRGRRIAAMRSREINGKLRPHSWKEIAKDVGLSESQCGLVYGQFLEWEAPLHDPMEVVQETIDALTVAMHEALRTYEAAPEGTSVRVQALRTGMDAAVTRLQVMRAAGRAPRSLAAPAVAQQMQVVFREFAELLRRHQVGDDALREFLELAEGQMGRMSAIEGRALPAAAA